MKMRLACVALLLTGCVIPSELGTSDTDEVDGSGSTTSGPSSSTTGSESVTSSASSAGASTMDDASSSSTGPQQDECLDVEPVNNPEMWNCNMEDDQCPACHKCTFRWDGDNSYDPTHTGTVCVPVDLDPQAAFEPCSYNNGEPNWDDCDAESICWSPDPDSNGGYCVPRCGVTLECAEGTFCLGTSEDEIGCVPTCNPLAPSCLDPTEACLATRHAFACLPALETVVGLGEPCVGWTSCEEGLYCLPAALAGPDCEGESCCAQACDLEAGGCTGPGESCLPSCMTAIEDPPHIGACGIEPDALPLSCPPPGIEPNIPWCSSLADECPENLAGGGDDCIDECYCNTSCDDVAECPVPQTGNAAMLCEPSDRLGLLGGCVLTCADGETCPDGMACSDVSYPGYCMWSRELEPGCAG